MDHGFTLVARRSRPGCRGQALIESCLAIGLLCLVLMGLFQLAQLFLARQILDYAAARGARARTVGFNDFMVSKTVRIGALANAGRLVFPEPAGGGPWAQWTLHESPRIPHYLAAHSWQVQSILNYEHWDSIRWSAPLAHPILRFDVRQDMPVLFFSNLFRAFFPGAAVPMRGRMELEAHYPLYLE